MAPSTYCELDRHDPNRSCVLPATTKVVLRDAAGVPDAVVRVCDDHADELTVTYEVAEADRHELVDVDAAAEDVEDVGG
jgi:hypothetical protein